MAQSGTLKAITIACPECDLLNRVPELAPGESANCSRCDCILSRNPLDSIDRALALNFTAILLYIVACYFPFLSFGKGGIMVETRLVSGIVGLAGEGMYFLATVVSFTTVIVPVFVMAGLCYLLLPLRHGHRLPGADWVFRWLMRLEPWNMVEIFMIGIIVAAVKLHKMANLVPDLAAWAFMLLIFVIAWTFNTLEPRIIWEKLERAR
ncbi:MAG: paraquat-inducible protein A [Halieaceae bacterium]